MKRQKLSGAQSRKKKRQTELCIKKQTGWLSNYLKKTKTTPAINVIAQFAGQSSASNTGTATLTVDSEDVAENEMEVGLTVTEDEIISPAASDSDSNTS